MFSPPGKPFSTSEQKNEIRTGKERITQRNKTIVLGGERSIGERRVVVMRDSWSERVFIEIALKRKSTMLH